MKFLPLVLKNILRKKTRSGLTVGSILLPFFVICLLGTFVAMLDADPSQGRGMFRIAVRHKVSFTNFLPASHLEKIRRLPGVKAAMPFNWFGGRYVDFSAFNVFERFAVDPAVFFDVFDADGVVEGSAEAWRSGPERPPRGPAPHAEVRLEARTEDHAHGRHLAGRLHVHDPRRLPRQRRGGRLLRPEGHRRDSARTRGALHDDLAQGASTRLPRARSSRASTRSSRTRPGPCARRPRRSSRTTTSRSSGT